MILGLAKVTETHLGIYERSLLVKLLDLIIDDVDPVCD